MNLAARRDEGVRRDRAHGTVAAEAADCGIFVRLLGAFRLYKNGLPVTVRVKGRTELLLASLAMRCGEGVPREVILDEVWPAAEPALAGQALNSLVYALRKSLGDAIDGQPPVIVANGAYYLNLDAGVTVDIARFDTLARTGDRMLQEHSTEAMSYYRRAIGLYGGDLLIGDGHQSLIERERLRARYLRLLARCASHDYEAGDLDSCLESALLLLEHDPCREDAHRLVMRCHVLMGERAQAMRQYMLCEQILRTEFDAEPEQATRALFQLVRSDPGSV